MVATVGLLGDDLLLEGAAEERRRQLGAADQEFLDRAASDYERALKGEEEALLYDIGGRLFDWLDGAEGWLQGLLEGAGPLAIEIRTSMNPKDGERLLLAAPWELLASKDGYLAADGVRLFQVTRRLGKPGDPAAPVHGDLFLLFMAAAPFGADSLSYEMEEVGIIEAMQGLPAYLAVEESGCLAFLGPRVALDAPIEALHLSCHGDIREGQAYLLLEDEVGKPAPATAPELAQKLGEHAPPLAFLSACRTAKDEAQAIPLAIDLVRAGVANVLGWDGSVYDVDASNFARVFYGELAGYQSVVQAAAVSRQALLRRKLEQPQEDVGKHWHLARVYLGGSGGGPICAAGKSRRSFKQQAGYREFLDKKGDRVPVASAKTFVGRRREAQRILATFREASHPGVLVHGMGALGKSSLAARLANRLPRYETVVVFERYDALAIFDAVTAALPERAQADFAITWRDQIKEDASVLQLALVEALEGPFELDDAANRKQPILLVIDDLERILEKPARGKPATPVRPDHVAPLAAVLGAFREANTGSRLLLTSRYDFTLPDKAGVDLAPGLFHLHLPPMRERERQKQQQVELRLEGITLPQVSSDGTEEGEAVVRQRALFDVCRKTARGNPGLQYLLTRSALTDATATATAIEAIEHFYATGEVPDEGDLGDFFQRVTLEVFREALTEAETAALRAALLFEQPVPTAIVAAAAAAAGVSETEAALGRLLGLGLLDAYAFESGDGDVELLVNPLGHPLFEALSEAEQQDLASQVIEALDAVWRDEDGDAPYDQRGVELFRLAAAAGTVPAILAAAATTGGRWLYDLHQEAKAALEMVERALAALDGADLTPGPYLIRLGAECADRLGQTETQDRLLQRGLALENTDPHAQAQLWLRWAARLRQTGDIEEAEGWIKRAETVYREAGDVRMIAITQGEIAGILFRRGEDEEALRIRREEELPVYERLGDVRMIANTQGEIADILSMRGEDEEALRIRREEQLPVYERLGVVRETAVAQGHIADILTRRGEYEEALRIQLEERLPIAERLQDQDTLAHIKFAAARIRLAKGIEDAETLRLVLDDLMEAFGSVKEMGRVDAVAGVGLELGRLLGGIGQRDATRTVLGEVVAALRQLKREDQAAQVEEMIAGLDEEGEE